MKLRVKSMIDRTPLCLLAAVGLIVLLLVATVAPASQTTPESEAAPAQGDTDPAPADQAQSDQAPQQDADQSDHAGDSKPTLGRKTPKGLGGLAGKKADANAMLWRMLASVAVIAALGAVAYFLLRRFGPRFKMAPTRRIRLLETLALGARKSVHLVEIDGRRLLLGSGRESISVLTQLEPDSPAPGAEPESDQNIQASADEAGEPKRSPGKGDFQRALQEQMQS
jgi:flagellar biosynthetic protein FliO